MIKRGARSIKIPIEGEVSQLKQHNNRYLNQILISSKPIHSNELSVLVPKVGKTIDSSDAIEVVRNKPLDIVIDIKVNESSVEAAELSFSKRHQRHLDVVKKKHETPPSLRKLRQNSFMRPNFKTTLQHKIDSDSPSKKKSKKPELIRIFELMAKKNNYTDRTVNKVENSDEKSVISGIKIDDSKVKVSDEIGQLSKRKSAQKPEKLALNKVDFEGGSTPRRPVRIHA